MVMILVDGHIQPYLFLPILLQLARFGMALLGLLQHPIFGMVLLGLLQHHMCGMALLGLSQKDKKNRANYEINHS